MKAFYQHNHENGVCKKGNRLNYSLHFHHYVELVYIIRGKGIAVIDEKEYTLADGDIVIVFPNQLHEYKNCEGEEYVLTIFKPEILPEFKDIFYNMLPNTSVYRSKNSNSLLLDTAKKIPEISESDRVYKDHIYRGMLLSFFGELFSDITLVKNKTSDLSTIKLLLNYCNENYKKDMRLDDVARHLHVSKYYISHLMNDKLDIGFNDYINSLRVADAAALLDTGKKDITEIARLSGFNTIRTFNRAFKTVYGISPSQYKRNHRLIYI